MRLMTTAAIALCALVLGACGGDDEGSATQAPAPTGAAEESGGETAGGAAQADGEQPYPEIVDVEAEAAGEGTYDFAVTISSPYDSPERYADGWRVLGPGGEVLGEMELTHDHANEQPFTRTQSGVEVPDEVERVTIEGHDLENGYGGEPFPVELPG